MTHFCFFIVLFNLNWPNRLEQLKLKDIVQKMGFSRFKCCNYCFFNVAVNFLKEKFQKKSFFRNFFPLLQHVPLWHKYTGLAYNIIIMYFKYTISMNIETNSVNACFKSVDQSPTLTGSHIKCDLYKMWLLYKFVKHFDVLTEHNK